MQYGERVAKDFPLVNWRRNIIRKLTRTLLGVFDADIPKVREGCAKLLAPLETCGALGAMEPWPGTIQELFLVAGRFVTGRPCDRRIPPES